MATFSFERQVGARPEVVFDVLTDHRRYADITRLRSAELEREGNPPPNGVGAIRVLRAVGPPMREEVLVHERPGRFSYKLLTGLPVRDHVGTVMLDATGEGTKLTYAVRTTPTVPLAGGIVVAVLKQAVKSLVEGVCAESERRAAADGDG